MKIDHDDRQRLCCKLKSDTPDRLGLTGARTAEYDHMAVAEPARRPVHPPAIRSVAEEDIEPAGAGGLCRRGEEG